MRRLPSRLFAPVTLALIGSCLASAAALAQTDRRGRTSPGLVLNTGTPTGECTALTFTADGRELLAAGLDKVVHAWLVKDGATPQLEERGRTLRWPTFREQRGSIDTMALSPDDGQRRVVVGGYGLKTGMLAIMDRPTGRIVQLLDEVAENSVVRAAAFDPSGQTVVYGTNSGSLWAWDVRPGQKNRLRRLRPAATEPNPVRLIAFVGPARCLTVSRDGAVLEWDLEALAGDAENPAVEPKQRGRFEGKELFAVAISPNGRRLAAAYERTAFRRTLEVLDLEGSDQRRFPAEQPGQFAHCLAFDPTGERLAVGCRVVPANTAFFHEAAGQVHVYDLRQRPAPRLPGPRLTYRPAAVAFHPTKPRFLATAGGDNHEVRLWDLDALNRDPGGKPVSDLTGPGTCLWGVRFDADDPRYIGFQERRAAAPPGPNRWGAGDYRVFDLERCEQGLRRAEPFRPEPVAESADGWTLRPMRDDARLWEVVDANGKTYPLDRKAGYDADLNGFPRCYAFLKARPGRAPRLAVGHNWGVSLFELPAAGPRLVRLMIGHAGEVMSLAVSPDQKTLVTASRDQTLCGWSLVDWPAQAELGARFQANQNQLVVGGLDPGGPTWEVGLQQTDELAVVLLGGPGGAVVYNPQNRDLARLYGVSFPPGLTVRTLAAAETAQALASGVKPNDYLFLAWKRDGRDLHERVQVWQRPMWRLFPTRAERGGEFVVWSYRDYYYHTNSPQADEYVGWHVNAAEGAADPTPAFHKLSQFERFKDRNKVRSLLQTFARLPERIIITQIEPPDVRLDYADQPKPGEAVRLRAAAEPRGDGAFRELESAQLWVNDYLLRSVPLTGGRLPETVVEVPAEKLRAGANTILLRCFNKGAVFADKSLEMAAATAARPAGQPRLLGVCVGIGDYTVFNAANAGPRCDPVASATADAEEVGALLTRQRGGPLFAEGVDVSVLTGREATKAGVLRRLASFGQTAPDDWLVLFLAGRGDLGPNPKFACHDGLLDLAELRAALAALPGRKLILLDVRPAAGSPAEGDPVRALTAGLPLMTFAACRPGELAADDEGHGLFVRTLGEALGDHFADADQDGDGFLSAAELARFLRLRIPARYQDLRNRLGAAAPGGASQNPIFYRDPLTTQPLLTKR